MKRQIVLAVAAIALLAGAPALAQQQGPGMGQGPGQGTGPGTGPRAERLALDRTALIEARLAAIRAGLSLSPEQEDLFAPLADTWREVSETRVERREAMRAERRGRFGPDDGRGFGPGRGMGPGMMMSHEEMRGRMGRGSGPGPGADGGYDFMESLERRAAVTAARSDELARLAEAMRPFWNSLDEGQRALLPVLVRETGGLVGAGRDGRRGGGYHHGMRGRGWN
ncbi:hypothetical protein [Salinarimonas sp.]|uniref:hypothetical protein n=1 Tax=Salinarimonas sp. TaxID=2766526 RepID=UPI0032D8FC08